MLGKIKIDRKSDTPAYKQVIEGVTSLIRSGKLTPGARLPSERELAQALGIARGTIKKAYEHLAQNNVIEVTHGRGSFVSSHQDVVKAGRKERAVRQIEDLLSSMERMKFSYREMQNLIDLKILEREERLQNFCVAAIDCNPESLSIYERQVGFLSHVRIVKILLDDLKKAPDPAERLSEFEIIFTTTTHYSEVIGLVPALQEKLFQVIVSPSQETVIRLAKISSAQRIGVITESKRFLSIIRRHVKSLHIPASTIHPLRIKDEAELGGFLEEQDVVITPPGYSLTRLRSNMSAVQAFRQRGGVVIPFDFQIERGSLLHLEERVKKLLQA